MVQNRLIEPGGFAGLLGSKDCLVALALMGLAGAADRSRQRVMAALTGANWPPADVAGAIAEAQVRLGGPLWLVEGNDLLTVL
jgi:hypothetical protein